MKNDFTLSNKIRSFNRLFLIILICVVGLILNVFSTHYHYRSFINKNAKYKFSSETLKCISGLKQEVKIFILLENSDLEVTNIIKNDLDKLFNEYFECNSLISAIFIDPNHESEELRILSQKTGILPMNVVVVQVNDRIKVLSIEEFYEVHNGEVVGFRGERLMTSTINNLVFEGKQNIYFTIGHGEFDINDFSPATGLSSLFNILRQKNYNVNILDFGKSSKVPEDANLVVIVGSKVSFLDTEISLLKNYLDKNGGNLIIAVNDTNDRSLNKFLLDRGICVSPEYCILPTGNDSGFNDDLLIKKFAIHEVTNDLINLKLPIVFGRTFEVRCAEWVSDLDNFQVTDLIQADGICNQQEGEFIVGVLFEKSMLNDTTIDILKGKMLVFGCADFLTNSKINILGNKILFCRAVDFLCENKIESTIHVADIKKYRLLLNFKQYLSIIICNAILCCSMIVLGIAVYVMRRR